MKNLVLPGHLAESVSKFYKMLPDQEISKLHPELGVKAVIRSEKIVDQLTEGNKAFLDKANAVREKVSACGLEVMADESVPVEEKNKVINERVAELEKAEGVEDFWKEPVTIELSDENFEYAKELFDKLGTKGIFQNNQGKESSFFLNREHLVVIASAFGLE